MKEDRYEWIELVGYAPMDGKRVKWPAPLPPAIKVPLFATAPSVRSFVAHDPMDMSDLPRALTFHKRDLGSGALMRYEYRG